MSVYTKHFPILTKVAEGVLFKDSFNRSDGSVGNSWKYLGNTQPSIVSNKLNINEPSVFPSGIYRELKTDREDDFDSVEVFFSLKTVGKNDLIEAKAILSIIKDDLNALIVEIQAGNSNPTWDSDKKINILTYINGNKSTVLSVPRSIDTSTEKTFRVIFDKEDIRLNYLTDGKFEESTEVYAKHFFPITKEEISLALLSQASEIVVDDLEIRSHEKAYFYGLPADWCVKAGRKLYSPIKGTVSIDTRFIPVNNDNTFTVSLISPSDSSGNNNETVLVENIVGGSGYGLFNITKIISLIGSSKVGKHPNGFDTSRQPVLFLDAGKSRLGTLSYQSGSDYTSFCIISDTEGLVKIYLEDMKSNVLSVFSSFSIKPKKKEYITLNVRDLPKDRDIVVWAELIR